MVLFLNVTLVNNDSVTASITKYGKGKKIKPCCSIKGKGCK
jgi:hypothetical protein